MAEESTATPRLYPTDLAFISNPSTLLATPIEIPCLVDKPFDYFNKGTDDEVEILVSFHGWFVKVHPLSDGNGGVIRLMFSFLAITAGFSGFKVMKAT